MNQVASLHTPRAAPFRLEAFVTSEDAKKAVERLLANTQSGMTASCHSGTLATAARLVGVTSLGDVLIAEVGTTPMETTLELVRELADEGVRLVLLGTQDDVRSYRSYISAGAEDYFVLPLDPDADITLGLTSAAEVFAPSPVNTRSIAICGVVGGVGASVLAQNLAATYLDLARAGQVSRDSTGKLALIDADLEFGSLAVDFDISMTTGFLEALQVPDRVDSTFLTATMAEPFGGLYVYSTELNDSSQRSRYSAGLPVLLRRLRQEFPTVVVDLPRALLAEQPKLADEFDELVLVMAPGFGAVRSTIRLMDKIGNTSAKTRVTHVLSHIRRDADLKKSEIASALAKPVPVELPQCGSDLSRAFIKGQPLQRLAQRGAYAKAVLRLAKHLETPAHAADGAKAKHKWFWQKGGS